MKKLTAILLVIALIFSFSVMTYSGGCSYADGDVNGDDSLTIEDARLALRGAIKAQTLETKAFNAADIDHSNTLTVTDARYILRCALNKDKVKNIPYAKITAKNVYGYPKTEGELVIRKLIVNGRESYMNAYTHGKNSKVVYVCACDMCWTMIGGIGAISVSKNEHTVGSFAARINGHLVHNSTTEALTYVDGKALTDSTPEYYGTDYYCTTLVFEKTLNATVKFSSDGSAVYITTDRVDEANSVGDDIKISADGTNFIYDENFKPAVEEDKTEAEETTKQTEEETTKSSGGTKYRTCVICGGQGRTLCSSCSGKGTLNSSTQQMVFDPVTNTYKYQTVPSTIICTGCAGTGYRTCSACSGSGHVYY